MFGIALLNRIVNMTVNIFIQDSRNLLDFKKDEHQELQFYIFSVLYYLHCLSKCHIILLLNFSLFLQFCFCVAVCSLVRQWPNAGSMQCHQSEMVNSQSVLHVDLLDIVVVWLWLCVAWWAVDRIAVIHCARSPMVLCVESFHQIWLFQHDWQSFWLVIQGIFCYRYMFHCFLSFILESGNVGQINLLLKLLL